MDRILHDELHRRRQVGEGWRILLELIRNAGLDPKDEYCVALALRSDHYLSHTLYPGVPNEETFLNNEPGLRTPAEI